ncbi:MAG: hypothetical protein Q9204_005283, partial [Flavoplaca sp. TL-2023a]
QLGEALEQFTEKLKPKRKSGLKNLTRALIWPFDKDYCEEILRKIERVKTRISLAVQRDTFTLGQAIKADTARLPLVDERVSTIAHHVDNQHINEAATRQKEILEWLSPLNFFTTQQDIIARREEGTGQWLLDSSPFNHWLSGAEPGAGKSVLASVVVDFLRTPPTKHDAIGVAAIYCNFNERDQQKPESLLAACCVQLIQPSRNPLREVLTDVYRKHDSGKTRPAWEDIVRVFEDSTKTHDAIYLVVDALDECSENTRQILLEYFKILPVNTRLLVTTRHIDEITREFIDSPKVEIRADPSDLKRYIASRIAGNRRLEGYVRDALSLKEHIYDKVIAKADGMFLAAKLHMDALSTKTNIKMLKRALENLSSNLNDLYDNALERIESQNQDHQELAEKALRWVAYTHRPLEVRALQEALAIDPDETDFNEEAITSIGLILDVCAGLLILDKENGIVRLVHYTAQDYFDKAQSTRFNNVHATIACDCITYLSYDCFQHPKDPSDHGTEGSDKESSESEESSDSEESGDSEESRGDTLTSSTKFSFLWYASNFWAQHAKMANRDAHLSTKIHQFLAGNPRVIIQEPWGIHSYTFRMMPPNSLQPRHGLEIAAFFGLCDELEEFHKATGKVDALTDDLNLLHLAACNDQPSAIQVLLDHGADIERRDCHGLTPLLRATLSKALEAATALVDRGADVMAEATESGISMCSDYLTPISSVRGDSLPQFVELLLGAGAKIQTRDIFDTTSLMYDIIVMNDVQTAEKLFEQHSGDQPTEKKINSSALVYASQFNRMKMVDMLLRYGADSNSQDTDAKTALHFALNRGNIDQVNHFLACGAEFTPQHLSYQAPLLTAAAIGGNEDCLLTVLRSGADVNRQNNLETALHVASRQGNLAGIKILLEHGANMELPDYGGKTALILAVENGYEDCVLTLLRNGANANAQDDFGKTALLIASFAGSLKMTHELCKHHATIGNRSKPLITLKYYRSLQHLPQYHNRRFYTPDNQEVQYTALGFHPGTHWWQLRDLLSIRKDLLDIRVWREGVTALDFAVLCQHDEIVSLLDSSAQSATESDSVAIEKYLFDLLGVSSAKEAKQELKRRIQEEKQELERRSEELREWEFRTAQVIKRFEEEEEPEEDDRLEE